MPSAPSDDDGAMPAVSGELLFHLGGRAAAVLPAPIGAWLRHEVSRDAVLERSAQALARLRRCRAATAARRQATRRELAAGDRRRQRVVARGLHDARAQTLALDAYVTKVTRALDSALSASLLRYASATVAERRGVGAAAAHEEATCAALDTQLRLTRRLGLFALHLEHETRGNIVVRRLPPTHPQFQRCRRAATENVKRGFFHDAARFDGLAVLDVYKVENRILLDSFQRAAAHAEPGKVKGLFCGVPQASLERLIVYGMHAGPADGTLLQHAFQEAWFAVDGADASAADAAKPPASPTKGGAVDGEGGHAQRAVTGSSPIPFPRAFSRHATLEEDRRLVGGGDAGAAPTGDGEHRFLALCRVMIGKIFVTSKATQGFPDVPLDAEFDSMYSPLQEEYKLLNPGYVLPEFIIEYQYTGKRAAGADVAPAGDVAAALTALGPATPAPPAAQRPPARPAAASTAISRIADGIGDYVDGFSAHPIDAERADTRKAGGGAAAAAAAAVERPSWAQDMPVSGGGGGGASGPESLSAQAGRVFVKPDHWIATRQAMHLRRRELELEIHQHFLHSHKARGRPQARDHQ